MDVCISVIVPTYNVEKYIEECLYTIIKQTLDNIEIICIDDGSEDETLDIIEQYAKKDNRINIFRQAHKGVAYARNKALKMAKGEYIMFVDGDDILCDKKVLETLYQEAKCQKVEVCGGNVILFEQDWLTGAKYPANKNPTFDKDERILFKDYGNPYGFTQFIYKKELLIKNNISFPMYQCWEDPVFMAETLSKAEHIYVLRRYVYGYRRKIHKKEHRMQDMIDLLSASVDLMKIGYENENIKLQEVTLNVLRSHTLRFLEVYDYDKEFLKKKLDEISKWLLVQLSNIEEQMHILRMEYYALERRKMREYVMHLISECRKNNIIIYGAGDYGKRFYKLLNGHNVKVSGFCVTYKQYDEPELLYGVSLKKIDEWLKDDEITSKSFVICVYDDLQRRIIQERLIKEHMNVFDINIHILDEKLEV